MNPPIPDGLPELLQDFTVEVLRCKPPNLVEFAATYFHELREKSKTGGLCSAESGASVAPISDEETGENGQVDDEEEFKPPPSFYRGRRASVSAEPFQPTEDDVDEKVIHQKTDEQRERLRTSVKNIFLFKTLDAEQLHEVLDAMFERKVTEGEHVIDQGDDGDNFYVVDSGVYDILVSIGGQEPKNMGCYDNTGSFGELALMYNTPRAATITARTDGCLWALDRAIFRRIVLQSAFKKRRVYETFLQSVPMLQSLDPYERMTLADALESKKFQPGDCIIRQGDEADAFYLVENGTVRISRTDTNDASREVELTTVSRGGYFGELALVTHKQRAANVYAQDEVTCAVLDVSAFERLLGPCMEIMKRNFDHYEQQLIDLFGSTMDVTDPR
ncbi:cAMP-dependent protein kinase type II regulatory subunit-like isoform X2 [Corticium candelabrum]|uniref:cAMP-dependent protein kinase type II regulatory subunit-like isoform X2 n=1 Tax=Corticium candelabrum TaxID=121492 RepID=UPI002E261B0E|nr:cAMP-dependent protein kinase type II regulatory subunit-like isoform X2 [Corticium candelabrum]